jgi:hypothetical protein
MEQIIREIRRFVLESPENHFTDSGPSYLEVPVIDFAATNDQLFIQFKEIIGEFHCPPPRSWEKPMAPTKEMPERSSAGYSPSSGQPAKATVRKSKLPSLERALTLSHGKRFNALLRMYLVLYLEMLERRQFPFSFPACGVR